MVYDKCSEITLSIRPKLWGKIYTLNVGPQALSFLKPQLLAAVPAIVVAICGRNPGS